jgi:hypothetical protein
VALVGVVMAGCCCALLLWPLDLSGTVLALDMLSAIGLFAVIVVMAEAVLAHVLFDLLL